MRELSRKWSERASDNLAAMALAARIENEDRHATPDEQAVLIRYTGFGASSLAHGMFPVREQDAKPEWANLRKSLHATATDTELRALARATRYAHYTPEYIARGLWRGVQRLGFRGGTILEPGCGTCLFPATAPEQVAMTFTGIESDPVTARIARLLRPPPADKIIRGDFTDPALNVGGPFDLAIGNPPFADDSIRGAPVPLSLHEWFIWRAMSAVRPGGLGAFVVSRYLMDKSGEDARRLLDQQSELVAAIRMPEKSMMWAAGTAVVVDLLFFRRRDKANTLPDPWIGTATVKADGGMITVNRWWTDHPDCVLGQHALRSHQWSPAAYTCLQVEGDAPLPSRLTTTIDATISAPKREDPRLPAPRRPGLTAPQSELTIGTIQIATVAEGATLRQGSYLIEAGKLCQIGPGGRIERVIVGRGQERIIRDMIPVRDAIRATLDAQQKDEPWQVPLASLQTAYSRFVAAHGPINRTIMSITQRVRTAVDVDQDTGIETETRVPYESTSYRRPNIRAFEGDPDVWLCCSIASYDLDTETETPGPIFTKRVCKPSITPRIESAHDALAVVLNEMGRVDIPRIAELLRKPDTDTIEELGDTVYRDPADGEWVIADAYLSGAVRSKLAAAEAAAAIDRQYSRNVEALSMVQPVDLRPSEISLRLGAPYVSVAYVQQFIKEVFGHSARISHTIETATWTVEDKWTFTQNRSKIVDFGTHRRHAGLLLEDVLNSRAPIIYDTEYDVDGKRRQVKNDTETELANDKITKIKQAWTDWVWRDSDRADDLASIYNARFNNLTPRKFDGSHQLLPGASVLEPFYPHQLDSIWRCVTAGSSYLAHAVGAGKTRAAIAAVMEQRRLGLIKKAMVVVPSQTLAQWAGEWMRMYPSANILVADEHNFKKEVRREFIARAGTGDWDAIVITHDAFKFVPAPANFEKELIMELIDQHEQALLNVDRDDRITRKDLERSKEKLERTLGKLDMRHDDLLTIEQLGVDQIVGDEFQTWRKLSFATNNKTLKGIQPKGSDRAWDMYVKVRFIDAHVNPGRAVIALSGTPIANTMGELYSLQRYIDPQQLADRGIQHFDAWAATFGDTATTLELQPSGLWKVVTRFALFINVPELIAMTRMTMDVVMRDDIAEYLHLPKVVGGTRQVRPSPPTDDFVRHQKKLAARIKIIEARKGPPQKGDDIILSVITDGRHLSISPRFMEPGLEPHPDEKINDMIRNVHAIWQETAGTTYVNPATKVPYARPGACQVIFSDIGTLAVEAKRGFSAYRWTVDELVRLGVPRSEIAIIHDYQTLSDKLRLWTLINSGAVRILIASREKGGTGANYQQRLIAAHHLDVPWMPYLIDQSEGRLVRQGNQNPEVRIFAYATETSMDAAMWQTLQRKLEFITAALKGDRSVRNMEDVSSEIDAYREAKAIASGDPTLMIKADLEAKVAKEIRLANATQDQQYMNRRLMDSYRARIERAGRLIPLMEQDLATLAPMEDGMFTLTVGDRDIPDRKDAAAALVAILRRMEADKSEADIVVGQYRGFPIRALGRRLRFDGKEGDYVLDLEMVKAGNRSGDLGWRGNTPGHKLIERMESEVYYLGSSLATERGSLESNRVQLQQLETAESKPYDRTKLDEMLAQLAEIDARLSRKEAA